MKTNLRWLKIAILGLAFSSMPALAQDPQYELSPSRQNNDLVQTQILDKADSALQHSAPAHQNSEQEALSKVAAQTSPAQEYGWNGATTICSIALLLFVVALFTLSRRPKQTELPGGQTQRAA